MPKGKEGDEDVATVSVRVLVGENKFREYRLPKSLTTDRSSLWRSTSEVGKRINEVLKQKKAKISEYQAEIKKMEKTCESWKTVAKSLNEDNENFFLDALLASEEDIAHFEIENFQKLSSWSKVRQISSLTEEARQELCPGTSEQKNTSSTNEDKPDHYCWVLQKTKATSSEPTVASSDENSNSDAATVSLDVQSSATFTQLKIKDEKAEVTLKTSCFTETVTLTVNESTKKEIQPGESTPTKDAEEKLSTKVLEEVSTSINGKEADLICMESENKNATGNGISSNGDVQQDKKTVEKEQSESKVESLVVSDEIQSTQKMDNSASLANSKTPLRSTPTVSGSQILNSITKNPLQDDENFPELSRSTSVKLDDKKSSTATVRNDTVEVNQQKNNNGPSLEAKCDSNEAVASKPKEECFKNGNDQGSPQTSLVGSINFPKLRLTSTSDQESVVQHSPQKVTNVWQQRAAEREKLKSEIESVSRSHAISTSPLTVYAPKPLENTKFAPINKEHATKQDKYIPKQKQHPEKVVAMPDIKMLSAREPAKKTDANGWTTLAPKKLQTGVTDVSSKKTVSSISTTTTNATKKVQDQKTPVPTALNKNGNGNTNGNAESSPPSLKAEEPIKNAELLEKRTLRRQRVQKKNKEKAKLAKEKEKKAKELLRMEQEEKMAELKQKKKEDEDREFIKKKQEIEASRKLREEAERLKIEDCEDALKEVFDCKRRMYDFLKTVQIPYRLIACNCYIATRLKELETDTKFDASSNKKKTILELKAQLKNLQWKNTHMMFINSLWTDKNKTFMLDDLLSYVHNDRYQIPIEHMNAYQRKVRAAFEEYCENRKCDPSEHMVKAIQFAEGLINKISAMENITAPYENSLMMLREYKELHHNMFEFIGAATYLRTRRDHPLYVLEEDYLLNIQRFEGEDNENRENGLKQMLAAMRAKQTEEKKKSSEEPVAENNGKGNNETDFRNDEEEEESIYIKHAFSQTDREPYDVIAATYLPIEN